VKRRVNLKSVKTKWMLTFSDVSTLLLTFFVMLFGISNITPEGYRLFKNILNVNINKSTKYPSENINFTPIQGVPIVRLTEKEIKLIDNLGELYNGYKGTGEIKLYSGYQKLTLIIGEKLLFQVNQYKLLPSSYKFLNNIGSILKQYKTSIVIEGHTDNTVSKKIDNELLSIKRAVAVLNYFKNTGVDTSNMAIAGYGSSNPLYPETTPENRSKNRRVEITIYLRRI
jgi:chemotaxis protein MotB